MEDIQGKYEKLLNEYNTLRIENEELKSIPQQHGIAYPREDLFSNKTFPTVKLFRSEKITLFRSYFKGRDDVFARRWFSKTTEKSGYQPVCMNKWHRGVCDKKKYKCTECPNRNFASLTAQDYYRHLEGKDENGCDVIGLYAILPDNKCTFLCIDFDDKNCTHGYKEDVLALLLFGKKEK